MKGMLNRLTSRFCADRPGSSGRMPGRALLLVLLASLAGLAQAERNLSARYIANANGDIALIGNAILTCTPGANIAGGTWSAGITTCANTLNGTGNTAADRNDGYIMQNIDIDSDGATFNSSSADLNVPAGSTVLFAGLYWSGISANTARNQVLLRTPSSFGYATVTASIVDTSTFRTDSYQGFADITSRVVAGGNGTYTVGNIHATLNQGDYGAWSIIVVYQNNAQPLRNLAVYDGFRLLNGNSETIPVSGFLTPLSGPVVTRLGALTYEGDRPATGDTFSINGTQLTDAANPVNNFYNATITDLGVNVTARNPASVNNTVFDIDRVNVPIGIVGNGATSATIQVSSPNSEEQFIVGAITFATELYVPIITPNVLKTAEDLNGGYLLAGDTLRWKVEMSNTGLDTGTNLIATDNIPPGLTYLPGSLVVLTGANAGGKSDTIGDDQAEYISTGTPRVIFRLGTGANGTTGGSLPYGAATSFHFDTVVNSGLPAGTILSNSVSISYSGQTIGDVYTASSAAATAVVVAPPTISKSFSPNVIDVGSVSVLTITVGNPAGNPGNLTGVSFSDTYPAGLINAATPNPQIACTPGSTPGTITGGVASGNSIGLSPGATIAVNGSCTITVNVTSNTIGNYTNTTSVVSSTNGGSSLGASSAVLSVGRPSITKAFSPTSIASGGTSTITFVLTNLSATALTNVAFSDPLTNMQVAGTPAVSNTCGGTVSAAPASTSIALTGGALAGSGSCTISVNVTSGTMGVHPNTTTGVSSTESGAAGNPSNTASLTVIAPPVVTKSFFPISVRTNVPSQMTLTVSNPNATVTLTSVAFNDTYPAGMRNDTPANLTLNCTVGSSGSTTGGADNGTTVGFTGGSLAPGGSCTITVNVEGTTTGNKNNTTTAPTSANGGTGTAAAATLNITALTAPGVTKAFGAASIPTGGTTTLTITLTANNATAITGVNFVDTFPLGLVVAPTPGLNYTCTGGTVTGATAGSSVLSLSGATIPASSSCLVRVNVTSSQTGEFVNTTGTVYTNNGGTFGPALATLNVLAPPQITKTFSPSSIAVGNGTDANWSTLSITFSNPTTATVSLTGIGVQDFFPANVVTHNTPNRTSNCGGSGTAASRFQIRNAANTGWEDTFAGGRVAVRVQNVTLAPNTTCTVSVRVRSATAGAYTNVTTAVTSTNGGNGSTATAILTVGRPGLTKSFTPATIAVGGSSLLTLTLSNPTGVAMTGATFTDTYPVGMTNTATPGAAKTCANGTLTAVANGGSISLGGVGGTIPANSSCTVTVNVTATETLTNTVPAGGLTTSGGSNGNDASAQLTVYQRPGVTKAFSPAVVLPNVTSRLTITLVNNNAVNATGVAFTDNYPTNLVNTASPGITNTCGGTATGAASGTSLTLTGATILANSSCSIGINVRSATAGAYLNTTGLVTTANIGSGIASEDTLTVMGPPVLAKGFSPASVLVGANSTMTITLTNPNTVDITGAAFTDTYPAGLVNAPTPAVSTSCVGGTATATGGGNSLTLSGATVPASSSCTVTVSVRSATAGSYNNTTSTVTTTNAGTGGTASATLTVNEPAPALSLLKLSAVISDPVNGNTFPKSIPGAIVAYTLRVTNTGPGAVDNNTFVVSDILPAQMALYVGDLGGPGGGGPIFFVNGSPSSGLSWTFTSLASGTDHVDFSNDNGATWTYTPVPDGNGFDAAINRIRLRPSGAMNAAGGGNPYVDFLFRMKVK
ncbi:MAG: hypothetical protein Q8J78_01810 [Moraxellaceae bacterium]|nr:hypothetical protein [Moraxellaceae bacterium]